MKQQPLIVLVWALMILLSSCMALDAPSAAAKQFMDSFGSGTHNSQYCSDATVANVKDAISQWYRNLVINSKLVDFSGLRYQTLNQTTDTADVQLSGKYSVSGSGDNIEIEKASHGVFKMKLEGGSWKVCGAGDEGFWSGEK